MSIHVTVWNEYRHERENEYIGSVYPQGIHGAIAQGLTAAGFDVGTATLDEPEHGLTEEVLANTDVLIWWGHKAHGVVEDAIVERVQKRVLAGMGLIVLHSGHHSKIFRKLMGTTCSLRWREADEREILWVVDPSHPIADGLDAYFEIPEAEMYGEHFDVPYPEAVVFTSWFEGGNVFRSGLCWHRGRGKIFYFRPGHETYPIYHMPVVRKVLANAVAWAAPGNGPAFTYNQGAINERESVHPIPEKHSDRVRMG